VNDRKITLKAELKDELKQMAADQTITITILRNKQLEKFKVKLGSK
jgi:S1-C subfamily serine protease